MEIKENVMKKTNINMLFSIPVMEVQLDLDLEKLTEFAFQLQDKDKKGSYRTNEGGWRSNDIDDEENHEEFIKVKKEITQYVHKYHLEIFGNIKFNENVIQDLGNIWVNINKKYHYNESHIHSFSTLSGTFYIKHDGSVENGSIEFKHPSHISMIDVHWPVGLVEKHNFITTPYIKFTPKPNMLLIFPSWLEHKVDINLKDEPRITAGFNSSAIPSGV